MPSKRFFSVIIVAPASDNNRSLGTEVATIGKCIIARLWSPVNNPFISSHISLYWSERWWHKNMKLIFSFYFYAERWCPSIKTCLWQKSMPVTETGGCRFMSVAVDHGRDGRWRCGETSFIKHRPRRKMYRRYLGSQYRCLWTVYRWFLKNRCIVSIPRTHGTSPA